MKTTVEVDDALLRRAKRAAREQGRSLRALIEEGLRRVLDAEPVESPEIPDRSVGDRDAPNPLEHLSWQDLRAEIYGSR